MRLNKGLLNASQINGNQLNNILGIALGNDKGLLNASQINGNRLNNILGITLGNESLVNQSRMTSMILSFKERVTLDGGTIYAETCLITTLEKLNNIN